jgi:hypothetical protein
MIFSMDHLALTCSHAGLACRYLKDMGYREVFSAPGVANPLIKKGLMKQWTVSHDLFFFERPEGFSIEVIRYKAVHNGRNFLSPVFENGGMVIGKTIGITAADLEASYQFWSLFGIKALKKEAGRYECTFKTPFSPEVFFTIAGGSNPGMETSLDSSGFNCLAFRCTSVAEDRESLLKKGIAVTPIEAVTVNGKKLSIFFAAGPQGEKVEMIGYN